MLDRLIRGRAWIPLLGVMLAGIVAMQVEALKLGASMGRSLQRTTTLQSRNEQLRESVAALTDDQRIERLAAGMGMVMPSPEAVSFLPGSAGDNVTQALGNIHAPDAAAFVSTLSLSAPLGTPSSVSTSLASASPAAPAASATSATPSQGAISQGPSSTAQPVSAPSGPATAAPAAPSSPASQPGTGVAVPSAGSGGAALSSAR